MNIEELIARQDALVAEVQKAFGARKPGAAAMTRPLALHEAQAGRVRSRIEALQQEKIARVAGIDAEIEALERELTDLDKRLEADRAMLAPVLKAAEAKPDKPPQRQNAAALPRRAERDREAC
jgi:uncharacterized protein YceH (UPF0502 family)